MELFAPAALAVVAGVVSFSSPCVLPLLPGYVAYVCGTSAAAGGSGAVAQRGRVRAGALLFVAGFAAVFTALGATASAVGGLLRRHLDVVTVVGGVVVVVMGLAMCGVLRVPWLLRQVRFGPARPGPGIGGAFPLGMAFAAGWTPCVGPVLASVLAAAASTAQPGRGAVLLLAYALGLGVPFVVLADGMARGRDRFSRLRRHARTIERAGGVALVGTGILMVTGWWTALMSPLLALFARLGWPPI